MFNRILLLAALAVLLCGCETPQVLSGYPDPTGEGSHPSLGLLPFIPVDRADQGKPGTTDIIHQAESLFFPYRLRSLLEQGDAWAKVRLLPTGSRTTDWRVEGRILASTPDLVQLSMRVLDQEDRILLDRAYTHRPVQGEKLFAPLFDSMIKDLNGLRYRYEPNPDLATIRFASDLLPDVYSGYLKTDKNGRTKIRRLPAEDDPVYQRLARVYEREGQLVDAMDAHYGRYYEAIDGPYGIWRNAVSGNAAKMAAYEKRSWLDPFLLIAGELTSGGGLFVEAAGGKEAAEKAYEQGRNWSSGYGAKAQQLRDDLKRSGMLVSSEMKPFTVEIQGKVESLQGTAAEQYAQWRELLGKMYTEETGIPLE